MSNELSVNELRRVCNPKDFKFKDTSSLKGLKEIVGQKRAVGALHFSITIDSHGYNTYAAGPLGTGKATIIKKMLEKEAESKNVPDDWLYTNNFEDKDKPRAIHLPAGKGREFKNDMDQMVEELKTEVPKAFESKEYGKEQEKIEQLFQRQIKELFQDLEQKVEEKHFVLVQTPHGMTAFPVEDDKILPPEDHGKLSEKDKLELEQTQEELQKEIRETLRKVETLQKKGRNNIRDLDLRVVKFRLDHLVNDLVEKYNEFECIVQYLNEARDFLLKNVTAFKQLKQKEHAQQAPQMIDPLAGAQEPSFDEYRVNLIVDNSELKGAPVIFEKNPAGPNLIGRIEQQGLFGALVTNFRMIKSGSLHRANGGYLIIEAFDLFQKPFAWEVLKRALKNNEIVIESMMESFGAFTTRTLEPEPIPLNMKVVLIGDPFIYYLLYEWDQAFKELFKVKADFETHIEWNKDTANQYAQFIGTICREENLNHFDPTAVAKIIEFASRSVDHQKKLTTKFGDIVDLIRQSNYWCHQGKNKLVTAKDVQKALDEKIYRSNRIEEYLQEMIDEGTIMIDIKGSVVGQINGLAVLSMGDYSFGKPSRITARVFPGNAGIINIDREVKLGGPIHNKGTMILTGFLGGRFAIHHPLTLTASITFEQMYEGVEGDSASSTEIYALLSALSGYPIRQDIAVTGSVNQFGEIQPIGGVNEKIEGFYQTCKAKGLTGKQGVMIPKKNIRHLMLHEEVIEAVKKKKFHIYAVETIDEGIEILTGKKAGKQKADGSFPAKTVNGAVFDKLDELAEIAKAFKKDLKGKKKDKKK